MHNVGINADNAVQVAQARAAMKVEWHGPALVEADDDKIVYEITVDIPAAGLSPPNANLPISLGDDRDNTAPTAITHDDNKERHYLLQACRSVIGDQPYNAYAP